ncbi:MAG: glycosyltransferase family 4 protein [Proteobacteria bacterium]|nr:glycosyltransferase family 4 protein [Pseudomonadota bacterium]
MKIAFVRKNYTPYGGAERYLSQLVTFLGRHGHEIHVFANRWEPIRENGATGRGKALPFFHRVPMIPNPSFLEALSFAFFSQRLMQQNSFDIIHSFERTLYQDIYRAGDGCHREWLLQRKKVDPWWKRHFYPLNPLHRTLLFLEKKLFQSSRLKLIIANSLRGKEEIMQHYRVPASKIRVIYNGVDRQRFNPQNLAQYRPEMRRKLGLKDIDSVMLFLGSGFKRKGLSFILKSLSSMEREDIKLLVVGKDDPTPYQKMARRLNILEQVIFTGPRQDVEKIYAAGDLFVLPSVYEPFSNACAEAMATGLPVITTRMNGVAELISPGENGYIIEDPREIPAMTGILKRALDHWGGGESRNPLVNPMPVIDLESNVREMMRIYEEVLAS